MNISPLTKNLLSILENDNILKIKNINISKYKVFEEFKILASLNQEIKVFECNNEIIVINNKHTFSRSFLV
jgi:hypothetical protein